MPDYNSLNSPNYLDDIQDPGIIKGTIVTIYEILEMFVWFFEQAAKWLLPEYHHDRESVGVMTLILMILACFLSCEAGRFVTKKWKEYKEKNQPLKATETKKTE